MNTRILFSTIMLASALCAGAQRFTDRLDRGLVAVPVQSGGGNFISWRIFGEEYYDTEYNIYRDGTKINSKPLKVSNFVDTSGRTTSTYQVAAVVRGVEQPLCEPVTRLANQYVEVPILEPIVDRKGVDVTANYVINDISLSDVTGDGRTEFIIKRNRKGITMYDDDGDMTRFHMLECYTMEGKRLWYIDLGPNMMSGPDEQWDIIAYDWDEDGHAEGLMRGADNMIIHTSTGHHIEIGDMGYVAPRHEYTCYGDEFLLYLNGETGEPYGWDGQTDKFTPMAYPLPRLEPGEEDYTVWGAADTGHRSTKHYFGAPFLDGHHASIFLGRGCYTRHKMCALDVNRQTHELTQRWYWQETDPASPWYGNGFHNYAIADVDWDGRDEIVFGSMVIDDTGLGLSTTGLGHGDAQHCGDLDPYRWGQEQFTCNETSPDMNYRNATTSKFYYRLQSNSDDGRCIADNFINDYPGSIGRSVHSNVISSVADKPIAGMENIISWSDCNFRIYWDGDLCSELLNGTGSAESYAVISKPGKGRIFTTEGNLCNSTKNSPSAQGDILGDWREEIVMRAKDNRHLLIYTTNEPTVWRNYTLWHDHQYRQSVVWQTVGYNQPPHTSYFLGEMEGITIAPPPLTLTGRMVATDAITTAMNDQHVLVCDMEHDNTVDVAPGVQPYIVTFNVPSHVTGTNSMSTTNPIINYDYRTCTVTGSPFTGSMRLVKQGEGTLVLPEGVHTHTGNTDIWGGTVVCNCTFTSSPLWLNRFAKLKSNGGRFLSLKADYASAIYPGGDGNIGTISTDTLKLGFGSRVVFDINGTTLTADRLNAASMSIETKNWEYGPKYLRPVFEFTPEGDVAYGRYDLGSVALAEGSSLADIIIEGLPATCKTTLSIADGKLCLDIEEMRQADIITWRGTESNVWDIAVTDNFVRADGSVSQFVTGDVVRLDDTSQQFNIALSGNIIADSIIVDNTKAYTLEGSGAITGNTMLVKRGSGILTVKTDNSYTGGTRLSGGVVVVTQLSNSSQETGGLGAVTPLATGFVMENGAELRTTAAVTQGSPMRMESEQGGVINNAADFIANRAFSGTQLEKRGTGTMKLNASNGSLNRLVVNGGTVQCISSQTPAKTVVMKNGTLIENTGNSHGIEVPEGGSGTWRLVNRQTFSNAIWGRGTLTVVCPAVELSTGYATRTSITGDWSSFEGTLIPQTNNSKYGFSLSNAFGMPNGTMNIPDGVTVLNTAKTYQIGRLQGNGSLGGNANFGSSVSGHNHWKAGDNRDFIWSGTVTGQDVEFSKTGLGKMTVRGEWDNSGQVTVEEGELCVYSSASLGTGPLVVDEGACFSGSTSTTATKLANTSYTIKGTLRPGLTATSTTGSLLLGGKDVTVPPSGRISLSFSANSGTAVKGIGSLTMNGTVELHLAEGYQPTEGTVLTLWEALQFDGTPSFELPQLADGLAWDTSNISTGTVRVTTTSGIVTLDAGNTRMADRNVYDLLGRTVRHNAASLAGLPAGIYIWKGRKVVLRS